MNPCIRISKEYLACRKFKPFYLGQRRIVMSEMADTLQDGNSPWEVLFQMQTPNFSKYLQFAAVCKEHQKIFRQSGLCESGFPVRKQPFWY